MTILNLDNLGEVKLTSVKITSASRAADTAELTFFESSPLSFAEELSICDKNGTLFHGYVTEEPEKVLSADGVTVTVKAENIVALMNVVPYAEDQSFKSFLLELKYVSRSRRMVDANAVVQRLLEYGNRKPGGGEAQEAFSVGFSSTIRCPIGSGSQTCWGLIEDCLHWVPNVVSWYDPSRQSLDFRTAESGWSLVLDTENNVAMLSDGSKKFAFAGFSAASFKRRSDLCPPVVCLSWDGALGLEDYILPEGGDVQQPWAFRFQVPKLGGSKTVNTPAAKKEAQENTQPHMLVQGRLVPEGGWANEGNMKKHSAVGDGVWHEFWKGFSAMTPLAKTSVACLSYGQAIFEPTPVEEAFPPGDLADDNEVPENYEAFKAGSMDKLYVLYQGQFPASSKSRDNVKGLKFCKGKLKQYVWLTGAYTGTLKEEEWREFFSGSHKVVLNEGGKAKNTRYALLELDAVFINRRRKKYQIGTNALPDDDDDKEESGGSGGGGVITYDDYIAAAQSYYAATRKIFFDGSITLHGVDGYTPGAISSFNLSIIGDNKIIPSEWGSMETPIVQAEYDPGRKTLTLTTGSPEILTIDERVQRTLLGRQSNQNSGTSFANVPYVAEDEEDSGSQEEEEEPYPMVSPSISAQTVVLKNSKPLNPFELYSETDSGGEVKWYINEGTLVAPGGKSIAFETTDITEKISGNPAGFRFSVRAERVGGEWQAVIRTQKK